MTFDEMVNNDLPIWRLHKGFKIGTKGKQLFWHFAPTRNGYYKIWPAYENGETGAPRYIDGTKTTIRLINLTE